MKTKLDLLVLTALLSLFMLSYKLDNNQIRRIFESELVVSSSTDLITMEPFYYSQPVYTNVLSRPKVSKHMMDRYPIEWVVVKQRYYYIPALVQIQDGTIHGNLRCALTSAP